MIVLRADQEKAVRQLKNGSILLGDTGGGKTYTALEYMKRRCEFKPRNLHIITTARKRDSGDWSEAELFGFSSTGFPTYTVDSWNNISKYIACENDLFIFSEQRLVGTQKWSRSFLKIARKNEWILLTATPGDVWKDYETVFIANGFYRNFTDFKQQHIVYKPYFDFPVISHYVNVDKLETHRHMITVTMDYKSKAKKNVYKLYSQYDREKYRRIVKTRFDEKPLSSVELAYSLRRVVSDAQSRLSNLSWVLGNHNRVIVFYNYVFELDKLVFHLKNLGVNYAVWNGSKHEEVPSSEKWVYLVQYTAGAEEWNCITTNCILFYSLPYSYKQLYQASGRINRYNTPYDQLYYYLCISDAPVETKLYKKLEQKEKFNAGLVFLKDAESIVF